VRRNPLTFVEALTAALLAGIVRGIAGQVEHVAQPRRRRRRSAVAIRPPPPPKGPSAQTFPPQFQNREAWLAWCEQDRNDEAMENTLPW
jgi:hypothetical protein